MSISKLQHTADAVEHMMKLEGFLKLREAEEWTEEVVDNVRHHVAQLSGFLLSPEVDWALTGDPAVEQTAHAVHQEALIALAA